MVPPVPTPATNTSIAPPVSRQISSAVVRRWISGLAGFLNCCGTIASGVSRASSSARAMAPFMPCAAGVSTSSAPSSASILRRSIDIEFRHDQDQPVAARGGDESERDAGVARGRLDQHRALANLALRLQRIDHRNADAVLDAADRIEEFELGENVRLDAVLFRQPVEPHQRRRADRFGDRIINTSAEFGVGVRCRRRSGPRWSFGQDLRHGFFSGLRRGIFNRRLGDG